MQVILTFQNEEILTNRSFSKIMAADSGNLRSLGLIADAFTFTNISLDLEEQMANPKV